MMVPRRFRSSKDSADQLLILAERASGSWGIFVVTTVSVKPDSEPRRCLVGVPEMTHRRSQDNLARSRTRSLSDELVKWPSSDKGSLGQYSRRTRGAAASPIMTRFQRMRDNGDWCPDLSTPESLMFAASARKSVSNRPGRISQRSRRGPGADIRASDIRTTCRRKRPSGVTYLDRAGRLTSAASMVPKSGISVELVVAPASATLGPTVTTRTAPGSRCFPISARH